MILQAYWLPLKRFGDILKIFWPAFIIVPFVVTYAFNMTSAYSTAQLSILVALWLYFFIVFSAGVVNWHRVLVLSNPPERAKFFPAHREWRYLLLVILYFIAALMLVLGTFFAVYKILSAFGPSFGSKFYEQILKPTEIVAFLIGSFLFALLFRRMVLWLPGVAVDHKNFLNDENIKNKVTKNLRWVVEIFAVTVIAELIIRIPSGLEKLAKTIGIISAATAKNPYVQLSFELMHVAVVYYCALVYATLLSLFYRECIAAETRADKRS